MKTILGKNYYSIKEVAEHIGMPYLTFIRWKDKGVFNTVQFGARFFLTEEDFKNLEKTLIKTK
jgi:hypothetical protein